MKFIDLKKQYTRLQPAVNEAINRVLESQHYIMGAEVETLEATLAEYAGVKHCITVSSGTDALLVSLLALGVGPGDEVITPAFGFIAAAEVTLLLGATPVFIDIDPRTYNLNPDWLSTVITDKTRAIVPLSLYGQCAEYDTINSIAQKRGIPVIDDAAQSFGGTYHGQRSGGLATITCTSFYPTKPLGCYGDGGACLTNDDKLAQAMREIRHHGQSGVYQHDRVGITGRLDTIQAAVLLEKMRIFDDEIAKRQAIAKQYSTLLREVKGISTPYVKSHNTSAWAQYTIETGNRNECRAYLAERNIPTAIHYPTLIYDQAPYQHLKSAEPIFHHSEKLSQRVLSLPMHPYMETEEIAQVAEAIKAFSLQEIVPSG